VTQAAIITSRYEEASQVLCSRKYINIGCATRMSFYGACESDKIGSSLRFETEVATRRDATTGVRPAHASSSPLLGPSTPPYLRCFQVSRDTTSFPLSMLHVIDHTMDQL
jgi:hypothetical protein